MRRLSYKAVSVIVVSSLVGGFLGSFFFVRRLRPREFKREFSAINVLYERGDYKRAIAGYESLAARYNMQCMSLYYNLANACYKTDDLGRSILYYKKAQKLAPRDHDIAANLRLAQARAGVTFRPREGIATESPGSKLLKLFSLFEGVAASLTFRWSLVISVVLTVFFAKERRWLIRLSITLAVLFYLSLAATIYKAHVQKSFRQAVVLYGSSGVLMKPGGSERRTAVLQVGTIVQIKCRQNGWCRILMDNGEIGWVREDRLGEI